MRPLVCVNIPLTSSAGCATAVPQPQAGLPSADGTSKHTHTSMSQLCTAQHNREKPRLHAHPASQHLARAKMAKHVPQHAVPCTKRCCAWHAPAPKLHAGHHKMKQAVRTTCCTCVPHQNCPTTYRSHQPSNRTLLSQQSRQLTSESRQCCVRSGAGWLLLPLRCASAPRCRLGTGRCCAGSPPAGRG